MQTAGIKAGKRRIRREIGEMSKLFKSGKQFENNEGGRANSQEKGSETMFLLDGLVESAAVREQNSNVEAFG